MRVISTKDSGDVDIKGHILVVPGSGGVAQLAEFCVDAVIATFGLKRSGLLQSRHLQPVAMASAWRMPGAADAGAKPELTTGAELYQSESAPRLSVVQLRAGPIEGRRRVVAEELWRWACEAGAAEVLIISACSSHVQVDADLAASTRLRYVRVPSSEGGPVPPAGPAGMELPLLALGHGGWDAAEAAGAAGRFNPLLAEDEPQAAAPEPQPEAPKGGDLEAAMGLLRGSGLARSLLMAAGGGAAAAASAGPSVLCLVGLTSELFDFALTEQASKVSCLCLAGKLELKEAPAFVAPPSWHIKQAEFLGA
eukprot:TRINITY_DN45428_c0_g3_i1.p1 TRINITY_DN45428_c0_g3~~TRINITY_DN45428_c0_g3_i1.p1  ORF type:complete len:309 (-),score=85.78 TRINITY_DN45428_c0_g3_i1:211-1137(-)